MKSNVNIFSKGLDYAAPAMKELDLLDEGVLCSSQGTLTVDEWNREEGSLEF